MTCVRRLNEAARPLLVAHFLALSGDDRRLRFGLPVGASAIEAYVEAIDFDRDCVFAVDAHRDALVGVAHVALADSVAELGLSVVAAHRQRGIGRALFARAQMHARNRSMATLEMRCLHGNVPIIHLARSFRMEIARRGGETEARLDLAPASVASFAVEIASDALALCERAAELIVAAASRNRDSADRRRRLNGQTRASAYLDRRAT
jgi:GNAT superfamily N-acetyltransferase